MGQYRWDFRVFNWIGHVELEKIVMETQTVNQFWRTVFGINMLMGLVLAFGLFTNYEFGSRSLNLLFPISAFILSGVVLRKSIKSNWAGKRLKIVLALTPLIGGFPYLLTLVVCIFPLFTCTCAYGGGLTLNRRGDPVLLQRELSPNRMEISEVYYSVANGDGASGGFVEVYVKNKFLPFVRIKIYEIWTPESDDKFQNFIAWDGNTRVQVNSRPVARLKVARVIFVKPAVLDFLDEVLP